MKGLVFDIKEMAVFDGPGIRTTVFLKGCPLSCTWCHNPEGIDSRPQLMVSVHSCISCGACIEVCPHDANPVECTACGACISNCPLRLRRISGQWWEAEALAKELLKHRAILEANQGGITFSGGEPLLQHAFILEVIKHLDGLHCAIETSGYASSEVFKSVIDAMDHVIMDVKVIDDSIHTDYCGRSNKPILKNLDYLLHTKLPFVIRIPMIPGVNDTDENKEATARLLVGAKHLEKVQLLPYQKTAGAKYEMLSMQYNPRFDVDKEPNVDMKAFIDKKIPCEVL